MNAWPLLFSLVLWFSPGGALAAAEDPCTGDAETHLERGTELRRAERPAEALAEFRCAARLNPSARARAQAGLAEKALGRWLEAEVDLKAALAVDDPALVAHRAILEGELAKVAQHLGDLEVLGTPAGAEVLVQGRAWGRLPLAPLRLVAETVRLEVRAPGYEALARTVEVRAGVLTRETVGLVALAPLRRLDLRRLRIAALVGATALLAMGVAAQVAREVLVSQYNDDDLCQDDLGHTRLELCGGKRSAAQAAQAVALTGFVVGGALSAAALGLFMAERRERRVALVPTLGGVSLLGGF